MVKECGNDQPAAKDKQRHKVVDQKAVKPLKIVVGCKGSSPAQIAAQ